MTESAATSGPIAILGGSGQFGSGLAKRLAVAGATVIVAAPTLAEADRAAAEIRDSVAASTDSADVRPATAADAVRDGAIVVVALPESALASVLGDAAVSSALAGKPVISCVVPMLWARGDPPAYDTPAEGSAAEEIAALLPGAHIASAFHDISAWSLHQLGTDLPSDVFIAAQDESARNAALAVTAMLPVHSVVDVGPLRFSRETERLTVLICQVNRLTHQHTSVELSGIAPSSGGKALTA